MNYEFVLHRPGIESYHKKTGYPIGYEPVVSIFKAKSNTEARNIAVEMYRKTGLGPRGHFNVGRA